MAKKNEKRHLMVNAIISCLNKIKITQSFVVITLKGNYSRGFDTYFIKDKRLFPSRIVQLYLHYNAHNSVQINVLSTLSFSREIFTRNKRL